MCAARVDEPHHENANEVRVNVGDSHHANDDGCDRGDEGRANDRDRDGDLPQPCRARRANAAQRGSSLNRKRSSPIAD